MNDQERRIVAKCEEYGPEKVRRYITTGKWVGQNLKYAQAWIDRYERAERNSANAVQDALARSHAAAAADSAEAGRLQAIEASEANRLAREANEIARSARNMADRANAIAIRAMLIAIVSAIIMALIAAASR